ncbi:MAG: cyclase family protein [Candidatus Thermoplasmatota archaeon]
MSRYILLSYPINTATPSYGNTPPLQIEPYQQIAQGNSCNTSLIHMHNHLGTHIDAPYHFTNTGKKITDYPIEDFIFSHPIVLDIPKNPGELVLVDELQSYSSSLGSCDMIIFRTGFWKYRNETVYRLKNPGISPEIAHYLRTEYPNIRCVGIDSISISSFIHRELGRKAHTIFLQDKEYSSDPILLLEDMDLSSKKLTRLRQVFVCPLFIANLDSSPCTVVGVL